MTGNRAGLAVAIAMFLAFGLSSTASAKDHLFVGVAKCATCHKKELIGNQHAAWQKGPHAKAYTTLKGKEAIEIAKQKGLAGPPHESPECLECHVTAYGVEAARIRYPLKPSDGVQCESCHGPGSDYRKKKVMSDEKKAIAAGMWQPGEDAKICTACHNAESPSWDPIKFERADGSRVGFDFEKAKQEIAHEIPKDVKGHYLEQVAKKKAGGGASDDADE